MRKLISTFILLFCVTLGFGQAPFQVLYPQGTSLSNPIIMSNYNDTAAGKIEMNGWPFTGNFTINSINISNNSYPCGRSYPYPSSNRIYLNELFSGTSNTLCYASGPMPDTILYFLVRPITNEFTDSMYFVVGGSFPAFVPEYHTLEADMYPNPAYDKIQFKNLVENTVAHIYASNGNLISSTLVKNNLSSIDISSFTKGIYIIKTKDPSGNQRFGKFVKE